MEYDNGYFEAGTSIITLNSDSLKPERPPSNVDSTLLVALPLAASGVIIIAGTMLTLMSLYRKARKHLDSFMHCHVSIGDDGPSKPQEVCEVTANAAYETCNNNHTLQTRK